MEFYSNTNDQLRRWLYNSNIHDSTLVACYYNVCDKSLTVEAWNPIFMDKISLAFNDVLYVCFEKNEEYEFAVDSWKTISSLTLEGMESCKTQINDNQINNPMPLHLVFQFLSGSELHIISRKLTTHSNK